MLSILTNLILSVSQKLPIIKSDSHRTTNHNHHPIEESRDMIGKMVNNALAKGKEKGWGKKIKRIKKEVQGKEIQKTQDDHKVDVIAHNTAVTRGFFGFSQSKFAEDLICDAMEIDLSYSKDGNLIASHGRQSYFGMINPFASAVRIESFAKLMPTILKRNQSSSNKRFKIVMDTTDIEKSGQMLYDIVNIFSQNLTKEEIESIEFVAMGIGARHDAGKLVKAKYGNEIAYSLTCNRLHLMDITENRDEENKLELKIYSPKE